MEEDEKNEFGIVPVKMPLDKVECFFRNDDGMVVLPSPGSYDNEDDKCTGCSFMNMCSSFKTLYNEVKKIRTSENTSFDKKSDIEERVNRLECLLLNKDENSLKGYTLGERVGRLEKKLKQLSKKIDE